MAKPVCRGRSRGASGGRRLAWRRAPAGERCVCSPPCDAGRPLPLPCACACADHVSAQQAGRPAVGQTLRTSLASSLPGRGLGAVDAGCDTITRSPVRPRGSWCHRAAHSWGGGGWGVQGPELRRRLARDGIWCGSGCPSVFLLRPPPSPCPSTPGVRPGREPTVPPGGQIAGPRVGTVHVTLSSPGPETGPQRESLRSA